MKDLSMNGISKLTIDRRIRRRNMKRKFNSSVKWRNNKAKNYPDWKSSINKKGKLLRRITLIKFISNRPDSPNLARQEKLRTRSSMNTFKL